MVTAIDVFIEEGLVTGIAAFTVARGEGDELITGIDESELIIEVKVII